MQLRRSDHIPDKSKLRGEGGFIPCLATDSLMSFSMALINNIDTAVVQPRLESWLGRTFGDRNLVKTNNLRVPQSSGMSALTLVFEVELRGVGGAVETKNMVARSVPREGGVFQYCDLNREFNLLKTLHDHTSVPVPEPLGLELEDTSILGHPFMLMEAIEGRVASDDPPYTVEGWVMELSSSERQALADNSLKVFADLHNVDITQHDLYWLGERNIDSASISNKLQGHRDYYEWVRQGQSDKIIESGLDWLERNKPIYESEPVISWGDARLGNMIINDRLEVSAVIDWEMAGLGCREIDLAWWTFTRRFHTEGIGAPLPKGFPSEADMLARYSALTEYQPTNLGYYIVFSALRMCTSFLRLAHMLIEENLIPPDSPMLSSNPALSMLAQYIGVEGPSDKGAYFAGNR